MTAYGLAAPILYHLTRQYLFWHSWLRYLACNWEWVQLSRTERFLSQGWLLGWRGMLMLSCVIETCLLMLQNRGTKNLIVMSLEKSGTSWRYTSKMTTCQCSYPHVCIGFVQSPGTKHGWCGAGRTPYFTPTKQKLMLVVRLSLLVVRLSLISEPKRRKEGFYTCTSEQCWCFSEYLWYKKTNRAIENTNQGEWWD